MRNQFKPVTIRRFIMSGELKECDLGTQQYWDNRYKLDVSNFRDHGDVGDIWFGEESMERVCRWIFKNNQISTDSKIIDIGCGNGLLLVELAKNGYINLTGIDYSEDAIILAQEIARKQNVQIIYKVFDILKDEITDKYNMVHDKGTYDAISLSSDSKNNRQIYMNHVYNLLEEKGLFIITSCNWTEEELINYFSVKFCVLFVIPTPQFRFGGQTGKSVTSIVFQKSI